ncbi:hypothetical protein GCM10010435_17400 [Winogradskya consettensis]|uniref:Uncharacterized protein n=1 Tax=Winogradskya consettensis TaxID=113560 RepID=A0A919SVC8_9ACTN|nr:hypothetical protein [Actinoplanes consettensis]GIM78674.1 hypothetical protein Aco04nite_61650 [Actinoplanes consettensis]
MAICNGPDLYATARTNPGLVVALIAEAERRFMTEIPLTASGPWDPEAQEAMCAGLAAADELLTAAYRQRIKD